MVVASALAAADLDGLFRALADATRRDILSRVLAGEEASVSRLAARYGMSFAAVQKHVSVLERASLVRKHVRGAERIVRADPERLARAQAALAQLQGLWRARFNRLDDVLAEPRPRRNSPCPSPPSRPTPRRSR